MVLFSAAEAERSVSEVFLRDSVINVCFAAGLFCGGFVLWRVCFVAGVCHGMAEVR